MRFLSHVMEFKSREYKSRDGVFFDREKFKTPKIAAVYWIFCVFWVKFSKFFDSFLSVDYSVNN